jgi:hypothetical protein
VASQTLLELREIFPQGVKTGLLPLPRLHRARLTLSTHCLTIDRIGYDFCDLNLRNLDAVNLVVLKRETVAELTDLLVKVPAAKTGLIFHCAESVFTAFIVVRGRHLFLAFALEQH